MSFDMWDEDFLQTRASDVDDQYVSNENEIATDPKCVDCEENICINPLELDIKYKSSVSQFDLIKVLGKGGYGKVLLAKKNCGPDKGSLFAMKIMKKAMLVRSPKDTIHTRSERSILENLKHKFIVDLIYAFQTNDKLYLVMEYIPGGELYTHLEREGILSEHATCFYSAELILALEFLHKNGVVYRDLKPENILITMSGDIKLTDFGLCKESLGENQTHSFCGTIEYMAPEIVTRSGHTYCADWWSLGALMFDMLTGRPPFSSEDRNMAIEMILRGRIIIPSYISCLAKDLIKKLLVRRPELRLGFGSIEATSIKSHPFFKNMDFFKLLTGGVMPPFVPKLKNLEDTSLFDPCFSAMPPTDTPTNNSLNACFIDAFEGFTYVAPSIIQELNRYKNKASTVAKGKPIESSLYLECSKDSQKNETRMNQNMYPKSINNVSRYNFNIGNHASPDEDSSLFKHS